MAKLPDTMPNKNLVVMSTLNLNTYTVTFKVNGQVYHTAQIKYTFPITYPENPTVDGYTFKGWDSTVSTMPKNDVEINAIFEKIAMTKTATITFNPSSFSDPITVTYEEGMTWAEWMESPYYDTRFSNNDGYIYVANEYTTAGVQSAHLPVSDRNSNVYVVVHYYTRDEVYSNGEIINGEYTLYDTYNFQTYDTTVRGVSVTAKEGYTFAGWDELPKNVKTNTNVYGTFKLNSYTATFKVNGQVYHTAQVKYTFPITYPETPTVDGYTFKGWDSTISEMPANDVEINAVMEKIPTNITFTISVDSPMVDDPSDVQDVTFECLEGTTWEELITSQEGEELSVLNLSTFSHYRLRISGGDVISTTNGTNGGPFLTSNETQVMPGDTIIANHRYWIYDHLIG